MESKDEVTVARARYMNARRFSKEEAIAMSEYKAIYRAAVSTAFFPPRALPTTATLTATFTTATLSTIAWYKYLACIVCTTP